MPGLEGLQGSGWLSVPPRCLFASTVLGGGGALNDNTPAATPPHGSPERGRSGGDLAEATQPRVFGSKGGMLVLSPFGLGSVLLGVQA